MFRVFISGHLKSFSGGTTEFTFDGEPRSVAEALDALWLERTALRDRILNERGEIRQHVNIFYNGADVRRASGLQTEITDAGEIHIFNAVSGG